MAGGQLVSELGPISYKEGIAIVGYFKKVTQYHKLQESSKIGREAHRQIEKELVDKFGGQKEVTMTLKDRTIVRKDYVKPDGTCIIIKPDTPSGHKSAHSREKLMQSNGKRTETIFYDPKDKRYLENSPTYIGQKNNK